MPTERKMNEDEREESFEDFCVILPLSFFAESDDPRIQAIRVSRSRLERQRVWARWSLSIVGLALVPLFYAGVGRDSGATDLQGIAIASVGAWLMALLLWWAYARWAERRWRARLQAWTDENVTVRHQTEPTWELEIDVRKAGE